jgi:Dockerin type I domain
MYGKRLAATALLLLVLTPAAYVFGHPVAAGSVHPNPGLNITITNAQRFTSDVSYDFNSAVVQGVNGTAWVFWSYTFFNGNAWNPVIAYRTSNSPNYTYNPSAWSSSQSLVSTPQSQNIAPSVAQLRNGTLLLSFGSNRTGNFDIFLKRFSPATGWYPDQQMTLNTADEKTSSIVAASDGSLWLFWDRTINPTTANIFYKVWRSGSWSAEAALTNDTSNIENVEPSGFQTSDGTIWMVWSRTDTSSNLENLYYKTYRSGVWSSSVQLTSTTNQDHHPHISQDSNNTIWIAWNRELPVSSQVFQNDIFYTYSVNSGSSFIPEVNLTNDVGCSSVCPQDLMPSLAQLKDGRVYLFWSSNRDPQNYWDLYYDTTNPQPYHNVAVTNLTISSTKLHVGAIVMINVTVADTGNWPESFFLFLTATNASSTTIAAQYLSLAAGQSMRLTVNWNTSTMLPAKYKITANIPSQSTEIVTGDNTMSAGTLWLIPYADVNQDGRVDILDLATVAVAFGSTPGSPNWNPAADLNHDANINILDLAIVAAAFGQKS